MQKKQSTPKKLSTLQLIEKAKTLTDFLKISGVTITINQERVKNVDDIIPPLGDLELSVRYNGSQAIATYSEQQGCCANILLHNFDIHSHSEKTAESLARALFLLALELADLEDRTNIYFTHFTTGRHVDSSKAIGFKVSRTYTSRGTDNELADFYIEL